MTPRIGGLFFGYGGLDMAVQAVLGGELAWVSEIDKGACKIIAHRYPDVPNLGDITAIDWAKVAPVDVLTGGSPCQDLSTAGKRAGMTDGTRSNLWVAMREAVAVLRPSLVVWENVRGAYSAEADSDLERDPRLLDSVRRRDGEPILRALGRVLGDLADLGYDARWHGLRAADVGAPHGRFRVFLTAHPRSETRDERAGLRTDESTGHGRRQSPRGDRATLLPTPTTRDHKGRNQRDDTTCLTGALLPTPSAAQGGSLREGSESSYADLGRSIAGLLPTPRATDGTKGGPNQRGSSGDLMLSSAVHPLPTPTAQEPGGTLDDYQARLKAHDGRESTFQPLGMAVQLLPTPTSQAAKHGSDDRGPGTLDDSNLWGVATRLLPTPSVADTQGGRKSRSGERSNELLLNGIAHHEQWGKYADAIARWETLTRPAPAPTEPSPKTGKPRLSPAFTEWLMGLPGGWITDVPGITRNEALKRCGDGVVPQQAVAALRLMLDAREAVA